MSYKCFLCGAIDKATDDLNVREITGLGDVGGLNHPEHFHPSCLKEALVKGFSRSVEPDVPGRVVRRLPSSPAVPEEHTEAETLRAGIEAVRGIMTARLVVEALGVDDEPREGARRLWNEARDWLEALSKVIGGEEIHLEPIEVTTEQAESMMHRADSASPSRGLVEIADLIPPAPPDEPPVAHSVLVGLRNLVNEMDRSGFVVGQEDRIGDRWRTALRRVIASIEQERTPSPVPETRIADGVVAELRILLGSVQVLGDDAEDEDTDAWTAHLSTVIDTIEEGRTPPHPQRATAEIWEVVQTLRRWAVTGRQTEGGVPFSRAVNEMDRAAADIEEALQRAEAAEEIASPIVVELRCMLSEMDLIVTRNLLVEMGQMAMWRNLLREALNTIDTNRGEQRAESDRRDVETERLRHVAQRAEERMAEMFGSMNVAAENVLRVALDLDEAASGRLHNTAASLVRRLREVARRHLVMGGSTQEVAPRVERDLCSAGCGERTRAGDGHECLGPPSVTAPGLSDDETATLGVSEAEAMEMNIVSGGEHEEAANTGWACGLCGYTSNDNSEQHDCEFAHADADGSRADARSLLCSHCGEEAVAHRYHLPCFSWVCINCTTPRPDGCPATVEDATAERMFTRGDWTCATCGETERSESAHCCQFLVDPGGEASRRFLGLMRRCPHCRENVQMEAWHRVCDHWVCINCKTVGSCPNVEVHTIDDLTEEGGGGTHTSYRAPCRECGMRFDPRTRCLHGGSRPVSSGEPVSDDPSAGASRSWRVDRYARVCGSCNQDVPGGETHSCSEGQDGVVDTAWTCGACGMEEPVGAGHDCQFPIHPDAAEVPGPLRNAQGNRMVCFHCRESREMERFHLVCSRWVCDGCSTTVNCPSSEGQSPRPPSVQDRMLEGGNSAPAQSP